MSSLLCEKPVRRGINPSVVEDETTRVISDMGSRVSQAPSLLTVPRTANLHPSANAKSKHVKYERFAEGWRALARECKMWQCVSLVAKQVAVPKPRRRLSEKDLAPTSIITRKAGNQEKQACGHQPWQQRTRPQSRDRESWPRCNLGSGSTAGHPHTNLE
jgi:hypothetical protein